MGGEREFGSVSRETIATGRWTLADMRERRARQLRERWGGDPRFIWTHKRIMLVFERAALYAQFPPPPYEYPVWAPTHGQPLRLSEVARWSSLSAAGTTLPKRLAELAEWGYLIECSVEPPTYRMA